MFIKEARWFRDQLAQLPDGDVLPLLDIGSSTLQFRTVVQPHIDREIFEPLRERGGRVLHMDMKAAPGVDIVGDLTKRECLDRLAALDIRSVMLSNVLHHLLDPAPIVSAVQELVAPGGYLLLSGPYRYPYHRDPIDTMLRLTPADAQRMFPAFRLVSGEILDIGNWRNWNARERGGRGLGRAVMRLAAPFYRPAKWRELARQSPYFLRHAKAFAVVLKK